LSLETLRVFERGNVVVVAQHGIWRSIDTGEVTGEADIASQFRAHGERIMHFARYDSLDDALAMAGLRYADEITTDASAT
jgi:hypothetical protein